MLEECLDSDELLASLVLRIVLGPLILLSARVETNSLVSLMSFSSSACAQRRTFSCSTRAIQPMLLVPSLLLLGLPSLKPVLAAPQFDNPTGLAGIISPLPTTTLSSLPTETAVSGYDQAALDALWALVEEDLPVAEPPISNVQPVNYSFTVPDTPTLPRSLQDHAP